MDVEKAGCYKLYRCRSLLACDSGGTVYETSQRFENSDGEILYRNIDESQSESGQSENIIYIIDKDNEVKVSSNHPRQQSLADSNYCLDDETFINCEPCSKVNYESKYVKEEHSSQDDNCKYYIVQCDDIDSTQNSTLDSDSFDRENFEYYCESINLSSSVEDVSINSSNFDTVSGNIFIYDQEQVQFHSLSNFSQDAENSLAFEDLDESENYSSINQEIEPTTKHTHKRKQSYKIKSDSCTKLLVNDNDDSSDAPSANEVSKKKRIACSETNQRRKLQSQKYNPFENLKMSSILKKEQSTKKQIQSMNCTGDSLASTIDDQNSELSNVSSSDEVFNCIERSFQSRYSSYFSSNDHFFKIIDTSVRLNSDLTNADYLEYVQPREKIVESDMDKLLSPTIEVEISTIMKNCQINHHVEETRQVDCNGNDVNLNQSSMISASEAVEKQLVSKAIYAIKLGFQNIFNTSNECVIDEILYDHSFTCEDIQLEIDLEGIKKSPAPEAPFLFLENRHHYHHQVNDPFKNVSCSLKDTLNEFDSFGGFVEDNSNEEDKVNLGQIRRLNTFRKEHEYIQIKPYSSFNSLMEANPISSDVNSNYSLTKYQVSNSSINDNLSIAPLKMRIKRVSDDNQYVIDDSSIYHVQVNSKATSKFQKNPDSKYECSYCSQKFRTKRLLKSHISDNHRGPYDMECEICHMKSKRNSAYKKHKPWCAKSTALKCEVCQKVYRYKAVLLRHLNTHKVAI